MTCDQRGQSLVTLYERSRVTLENIATQRSVTPDERRQTRAQPKTRTILVER